MSICQKVIGGGGQCRSNRDFHLVHAFHALATMHGLPVMTRPKIKMVQLQFTPFASDDTYHWQTTMGYIVDRSVISAPPP
ncbi:hypothetical protein PS25CTX_1420 (plasmid) [Escherichia coli]